MHVALVETWAANVEIWAANLQQGAKTAMAPGTQGHWCCHPCMGRSMPRFIPADRLRSPPATAQATSTSV